MKRKKEPPQWPHSSYVVAENGSHILTRRCGVGVLKREKNQGARDTTYFEPLVVVIVVSGGGKGKK